MIVPVSVILIWYKIIKVSCILKIGLPLNVNLKLEAFCRKFSSRSVQS